MAATNYDVIVLDAWFDIDQPLERLDIEALKRKPGSGKRLVLAYLSIGEAEDYRSDWDPSWNSHPPTWPGDENPDWAGNYAVEFSAPEWQAIVAARLAGTRSRLRRRVP
jgi:cysteinyl-tRNA synthetase